MKDIVCWLGGEEFLVIMLEMLGDFVYIGVECICYVIVVDLFLVEWNNEEIYVIVSVGVVMYYGENVLLVDLLYCVD